LEIKNISVDPEAEGRYIGSFLLRNSEIEAAKVDFPDIEHVTIDTKRTNQGMVEFLLDHGYQLQEVTDLYGTGTGLDAVFTKSLVAR
jgi:ribosomal protein S18 acetylase RimI-like enzyme